MKHIQLADDKSYEALTDVQQDAQAPHKGIRTLRDLADVVSTQLSVDTVLQEALDQTLDTLGFEAGAITLIDAADNMLVFKAQKGWRVHDFVTQPVRLKNDTGLAGLVVQTGHPAVTSDVKNDARITNDAFREEPVQAMVITPMRARGRVLGLLSVMSYTPRQFTEYDIVLLTAVADQVGVAVDNAALYEAEQTRRHEAEGLLLRERRRAEEMALLRETTVKISASNVLAEMLNFLAQTTQKISQAPLIEIDLYNSTDNQLTFGTALRDDGSRDPLSLALDENTITLAALQHDKIFKQSILPGNDSFSNEVVYLIAIPMTSPLTNGVILLGYRQEIELDEQTYHSLALLADLASLNLERLRSQKEENRKSTHLSLVNQISQTAVKELRSPTLISEVVQLIQQTFKLYNASLYLGQPLNLRASSGGESTFLGSRVERGLAVQAVTSRQALLANNIREDARCAPPAWVAEEARAEMAIPLMSSPSAPLKHSAANLENHKEYGPRQQVIGVLDIFSRDRDAFDAIDLQTMNTLAGQLSVILESVNLYTQMEQRIDELSAIQNITLQLLGAQDTDYINRTVVRPFLDALNADAVVVYPVRENHIVPPGTHLAQPGQHLAKDFATQLSHEALTQHQSLLAGEVSGLPWKRSERHWQKNGGVLVIPLSDWGIYHGLLVIYYQAAINFSKADEQALNLLTNLAAVAMSKAVLYEERQQQIQELSLLYKMALKTRALTKPEDIAQEFSAALSKTMHWHKTDVYRWDKDAEGLILLRKKNTYPLILPLGEGVVGWVAKNRMPLSLTPDKTTNSPDPNNTSAEIAIPMMVGDRLVGVLHTHTGTNQPLSKREQNFLTTVGHLLAVTLDNVALYEQIQRQLKETTTLYNITRTVSYSRFLDEVLQEIVVAVHQALNARGVSIALINGKQLIIRAAIGIKEHWQKEARLQLGQGIAGAVALNGKPTYVPDTYSDKEFLFFDHEVRALIVVPLLTSKGDIIGTLSVDSGIPYAFTPADEHLLSVAASQAAIAIENVRLYENLEKRNQRLKKAYEKLRELNKLKDQIVQNVSHELRTPLTFIKGYTELLAEGGMGPLNDEQRVSLEVVARKANDVVHIVGEIVSLQPLNEAALDKTAIPIQEVLQEVISIFKSRVAGTQITLHLNPIAESLDVYGDPERIKQLCYNILDNAVKFSPEGGHVNVAARLENQYIHLMFTDEGIGIRENQLGQIFDTFYQIDGSATRRFGGLGLGLAVVKRIVQAHKGEIWAESELNKGSTFHILLPQYIPEP